MTEESPLARKLGITPGCSICLLDAPAPSAALLREACPPGVALTEDESGDHQVRQVRQVRQERQVRYDLIFLWPQRLDGLTAQLAALQWRIHPSGAIWVMLLKKPVARRRGVTLTWEDTQAAALLTDLVDNKIAAFSEEEYGTRFVIRRERRPLYAAPRPAAR